MKAAITIDDVARRAGVSPKTVSRVINGEANVREPTRDAVRRAIAELGYQPNLAARSLASARSRLIGLISMRMDSYYFRAIHSYGVRACHERGLHLIVEELEAINRQTLQHLETAIRQMRFEGVILTQLSNQPEILDLLERLQVPYVRIAAERQPQRADSVRADVLQGLKLQAEYLWNLGHRRIVIAAPKKDWREQLRSDLIALGGDPKQIRIQSINWRKSPLEAGRELTATVLAMPKRPTAIHAFNDEIAAAFIGYAWAHGIHVPRDMSVIGFDDAEIAQAVWPPITTVRQPLDQMVRAAVKLLAEPSSDGKPREVVCPVELIVRGSTSTAPAAI